VNNSHRASVADSWRLAVSVAKKALSASNYANWLSKFISPVQRQFRGGCAAFVHCLTHGYQGVITFINDNFAKISGYPKEELIGKTHSILNSAYHPRSFWQEMWSTITRGEIWRGQVCNLAKNGSLYWVDTFIYPYFDEQGDLKEYFSIRNDITQHVFSREELSKSSSQMRAILNNTTDAYFLVSTELKLITFNAMAEKMVGCDASNRAVFDNTFRELFHLQTGAQEKFERALTGELITLESEVIFPDGHTEWHRVRYLPSYDNEQQLIGVSICLTNIHDRKLQRIALKKSESHMRAVLNSTNDIYFLLSPERKLLNINIAGQKNLAEFWDAEASTNYEAALIRAMNGYPPAWEDFERALKGEIVETEIELMRLSNAEKIWHQGRQLPAYDDDHNIIGVSIVLTDIHARKIQEAQLKKSEMLYRTILNSTNDIYFFLNRDMKLLAVNDLGRKLLAQYWDAKNNEEIEVAMARVHRLMPGSRDAVIRALQGETVEQETEIVRPNGTSIWYQIRNLPVYDNANNIMGASVVFTNIHQRKMQQKEIEQKNQTLLEVAWSHSHEIRRPVASILGLVQLLQSDTKLLSDYEFMSHMKEMTKELDSVIRKNIDRTYL
jgi:PAS domain S-box-containing protein